MESLMSNTRSPRALFFAMQGNFSAPSLAALLESGIEVAAVIVPASAVSRNKPVAIKRLERPRVVRSLLPLINTSAYASIVQTAWIRDIPVWEVSRLADPEAVATLAAYQPDI